MNQNGPQAVLALRASRLGRLRKMQECTRLLRLDVPGQH